MDDDLRRILVTLRRVAPIVLTSAALAGGLAALLAARQSPSYVASSSLVSLQNDAGEGLLRDTVFTAPPVQLGALQEALQTSSVLQGVLTSVQGSDLPPDTVRELSGEVQAQRSGGGSFLSVAARGSTPQDRGIYEVKAFATTPQGARALADAGASALIRWDVQRARRELVNLRGRLERQFDALDARLRSGSTANSQRARLEQQTLSAARDQVLRNLAQVTVLEPSTAATLGRLAVAASPVRSLSPSPLRIGFIAALLTLLLSAGTLLLLDRTRRRVYDQQDLQVWSVPLLGHLPPLRGHSGHNAQQGVVAASGPWRGPLGFVRVNLLSQLGTEGLRRIVIASVNSGEGQSTVTAALAAHLAAGGERVLIVEADPQKVVQAQLWQAAPDHRDHAPLLPALVESGVESLPLGEGVDLLLSAALRRRDGGLDDTKLNSWLDTCAHTYDTVLFDTPSLLASPDALTLAAHAQGLVLIVTAGLTSYRDLEATFAATSTAQVEVLGLLLTEPPGPTHVAGRVTPLESPDRKSEEATAH